MSTSIVTDPSRCTLRASELEAVFLPGHGMLGASLRHQGVELLRRVDDLDGAAARGSSAGIPLLHPWANRLAKAGYRILGKDVSLDLASPLIHLDENQLPIHGTPWSKLVWTPTEIAQDRLTARLDWNRDDLLAVFPFRHQLEMRVALAPAGLTIETTLHAGGDGPTPVSFGFHPYFGLSGLPREKWRLELPAMRKLVLDARGIPTGAEESCGPVDVLLDERSFDDGFATLDDRAELTISGGGRRIGVELLGGYRFAQVFAPKGKDFVALEPMTAPTNALVSSQSVRIVPAGGEFRAAFRVRVTKTNP